MAVPERTAYCQGRLVREPAYDPVRKCGTDRVFAGYRWLLDGEPVALIVVEAFLIVWAADRG